MGKLYFLLMMLCVSGMGYAQDEAVPAEATTAETGGIMVGAKVGGSLTYLWGQGRSTTTTRPFPGVSIGGYARYQIKDKISIQPELLFSTRGISTQKYVGYNYEGNGFYSGDPQLPTQGFTPDGPYSSKTRVNIFYLDLPIMVQYQVQENISLEAGPMISLNIWDQYPKTKTSDGVRIIGDRAYSRIKPWQFALAFGGSYRFDLMGYNLVAGARYSLGLTRINAPVRANDDLKMSMFQIFLAYDIKNLKF